MLQVGNGGRTNLEPYETQVSVPPLGYSDTTHSLARAQRTAPTYLADWMSGTL